jgi:hypothetical protein
MTALPDMRKELTNQANKPGGFIERNQAAAHRQKQCFGDHALGIKGMRLWRGSNSHSQRIDRHLGLSVCDPEQHKLGKIRQLGFLCANPLPSLRVDYVYIRWKSLEGLFDIQSASAVAERFELEFRMEKHACRQCLA